MKYLLLLCLCFGCKAPLNIIDLKTSVHGRVEDQHGHLLSNVQIQVEHTKIDFNTGDKNDFVLYGVTKDITLMFECEGYISQAITCSPGCNLKIKMEKQGFLDPKVIKLYYKLPTY